jgi:hypothetical protein
MQARNVKWSFKSPDCTNQSTNLCSQSISPQMRSTISCLQKKGSTLNPKSAIPCDNLN